MNEPSPIPMIFDSRAVAAVDGGMSRRKAAEVFSVGVSSVIRWVQQHQQTGSVSAKPMGGSRGTRIEGDGPGVAVGADRGPAGPDSGGDCVTSWPSTGALWWAMARCGGSATARS